MKFWQQILFLIFLVYCGGLKAEEVRAKFVPESWEDSYDYKIRIDRYLLSQYNFAKEKSFSAYIYIYNDRHKHCVEVRKLLKKENVKEAFNGTHIVMLNSSELQKAYAKNPVGNIKVPNWIPVIVKISESGGLTNASIFPDIYLFHPNLTDGLRDHRGRHPLPTTVMVRELKKFFSANSDILKKQ